MSETATLARARPAPRRRDADARRAAILEAAKGQFARLGFDRAGLREIAGAAGVDVALIQRYFGGKAGLFTEALKASFRADRLREWDRATFAGDIAVMMAGDPHAHEARTQSFQFLLRAAASPTTAPLLNLAVQERFMAVPDPRLAGRRGRGPSGAGPRRRLHRPFGRAAHPRPAAGRTGAGGVHRTRDRDVRGDGRSLTPGVGVLFARLRRRTMRPS